MRHIAASNPKLLKPYYEQVIRSTESHYIAVLLNQKVVDMKTCLSIFRSLDQEKARKISQTLGAINLDQQTILKEIDETLWGRIMIGALGYVGKKETLPTLYGYL